MLGILFGEATAANPLLFVLEILSFLFDLQAKREPTSGLEPLTPAHYE